MTVFSEADRPILSAKDSRASEARYGGPDAPVLIRLPDVAAPSDAHHHAPRDERLTVLNPSQGDGNEARDGAPVPSPTVAETAARGTDALKKRRQRPVGRRTTRPNPTASRWLLGWNQIIVAALIAGALFIVTVTIQGKKPPKNTSDGVVPTPTAADDLANAPRAGEDDAANTPEMDLTPPAQATSAFPPAPASPSETTSTPATADLPNFGELDKLNTASWNRIQSGTATRPAAGALPQPATASNTRGASVRAMPPAYPTTGMAPLDLGRSDAPRSAEKAWRETVPMGTVRQARTPRSRSNYR